LIAITAPSKTNGDYIPVSDDYALAVPVTVVAPPVKIEVIQVPKTVKIKNDVYYLMVYEAFKDTPVMLRIASAESGFNPLAKNPASSASGIFQILKGTWKDYKCVGDVFDAEDNIACAKIIYARDGTRPWNASASVWK